ncbi:hypothetical protein CWB73_01435 [Pseudoalteromonas phenolica]|uniref:Uncharacterized protein n=1 Tax=Pseudoalteromonas phenolica TaxID=161398 RepID=A0A5S3YXV7_9GAMM|nr:hypothetical protein [Pseudoalteromonas phenolica]TMP83521.1 hypothetical protein CWB73_01435 [Pseudoalteromonas phenolica]
MKAHFYHPIDDSLEEKAKAYKEAYRAWLNIEASFHFHDQQGWEDRLGSKEDLQKAMETTTNTLEAAIGSFSIEDLNTLSQNGLIVGDELEHLEAHHNKDTKASIIEARKKEISNNRAESSSFDKGIEREK